MNYCYGMNLFVHASLLSKPQPRFQNFSRFLISKSEEVLETRLIKTLVFLENPEILAIFNILLKGYFLVNLEHHRSHI